MTRKDKSATNNITSSQNKAKTDKIENAKVDKNRGGNSQLKVNYKTDVKKVQQKRKRKINTPEDKIKSKKMNSINTKNSYNEKAKKFVIHMSEYAQNPSKMKLSNLDSEKKNTF